VVDPIQLSVRALGRAIGKLRHDSPRSSVGLASMVLVACQLGRAGLGERRLSRQVT
jgi:hypothetical protein